MIFVPFRLAALLALCCAIGAASAQDKTDKKTSSIKILLPENLHHEAEVKIEGVPTKQSGSERTFLTPALIPGKEYTYKIEALIEPNNYTKITRVREVKFKAGEELVVDLRKKDPSDEIHIRWVPTPADIAAKMCELAKIGKEDVVYDCGCGDGILLITAVKKFGAKKAVGFDFDPDKVTKSIDKVKDEGVADKISIKQNDSLKLKKEDLADCTVLMTYMGNDFNLQFRPILWNSLKPGTRIVSHRFVFGDWKPEKTIKVKGEDGDEYDLHVWTVTGKEKDGAYTKTDQLLGE
jgi:uncharacterized protein (TIGR03000 family)